MGIFRIMYDCMGDRFEVKFGFVQSSWQGSSLACFMCFVLCGYWCLFCKYSLVFFVLCFCWWSLLFCEYSLVLFGFVFVGNVTSLHIFGGFVFSLWLACLCHYFLAP